MKSSIDAFHKTYYSVIVKVLFSWYNTDIYVLQMNRFHSKKYYIDLKGAFMEAIKSRDDFKRFMENNREKIYANAIKADDITLDDEWMQEDQWDDIYKQGEKKNGEI